jgi:hypothetical protein
MAARTLPQEHAVTKTFASQADLAPKRIRLQRLLKRLSRAFGEASGIKPLRIWSARRGLEMWNSIA